jgi:hypothetical protein
LEADRLAHRRVNNHHILLGLLRAENCFASQVLRHNGLSTEYVRERLSTLQQSATEEPAPPTANGTGDLSAVDRKLYELEGSVIGLLQLKDYQGALKLVDDAVADPSLDRNHTARGLVQIASGIARIIGDGDLVRRYCELRLAGPSRRRDGALCISRLPRTARGSRPSEEGRTQVVRAELGTKQRGRRRSCRTD